MVNRGRAYFQKYILQDDANGEKMKLFTIFTQTGSRQLASAHPALTGGLLVPF